jgi:ring-1,2-phenylacetyl-CoA epoxidase subunit PaaB
MAARHYEVFRRERDARPLEHAGSLEAPDDRLATVYARQIFGRRGESELLWVVAREDVIVTPGPQPELDRSYRRVDGYSIKSKLRRARELAGTDQGE